MKKITLLCTVLTQGVFAVDFANTIVNNSFKINGYSSFGDVNGDGYTDIFTSGVQYHGYYGLIKEPPRLFINDGYGGFDGLEQEAGFGETPLEVWPIVDLFGQDTRYGKSFQTAIADINNDGINEFMVT